MNIPASLDWLPALAFLAVGLGLGAILVRRVFAASCSPARTSTGVPLQVRDLAGKRDALLRQLREMEDTASKRTPEQLARERYALELETAQVLLALDERRVSVDAIPAAADRGGQRRQGTSRHAHPATSARTGWRGFFWVTGSAAALLLLALIVVQSAKPRDPGGSLTGETPMRSRPAGVGNAGDREPRALAYQALMAMRRGRTQDAEAAIARLARRYPERAAELRRLLASRRNEEAATVQEGSAAASSGRRVSGTVDIDPSLTSTVPPGAVLFVFVREAGAGAGPPVAVKRLPATFPAAFELGEADSMMGRPFPDVLLLEARLDSDGDPSTRPATDPRARLDRVRAGRTDLHLVLRRP